MSTVASARYIPHDSPVVSSDTNLDKTAVGRRDTKSLERRFGHPQTTDMNDMNPQAMPFQPGGGAVDPRLWNRSRNENRPPPPAMPMHMPMPMPMPMPTPPFGFQGAPWNQNFRPPPPPPPFHPNNQFGYNQYEGFGQAQAHEQARQPFDQWAPSNHGHSGPQGHFPPQPSPRPHFQPYGPPPVFPPQQYPTQFQQQHRPPPRQPGYPQPHPAHHSPMPPMNWSQGATNEALQYAFNAMLQAKKSKKRSADDDDSAPAQPSKKNKKAKAKAKAVADGLEESQEYDPLDWMDSFEWSTSRIDKQHSTPQLGKGKKGKYGDEKIMLPAPQPTDVYKDTAAEEPSVVDPAGHVLVILDLNGTVLFRPNRNAKTMIARPYLKPFLQYLFTNFKVMVWSSAKPDNVKSLVEQSLGQDLRSMLVATWARDTFGLSAKYYGQNVQVYKNLRLVWSRDQIQQHHPEYEAGKRFGQHNTVLIDDSALKASAQPHNLLQIPEFEATPDQMAGDVLREVAGYLEVLRYQGDISKFIHKEPFKADGRWSYDWPADTASGGGELESRITLIGKTLSPNAAVVAGKKGKGSRKSKSPAGRSKSPLHKSKSVSPAVQDPANAVSKVAPESQGLSPVPVENMTNSLSSVSLNDGLKKDW